MTHPVAFIFDLDGVITDTAHYHYQAWKRTADKVGVPFTDHDNEQLKGVGRRESLEYILAKSSDSFSEAEIETLMHDKNEFYKSSISSMNPNDLLPGVKRLLCDLHVRGHKIGLASASKNALMVLGGLGVRALFDYVADAATIPNGKPAPDVFLDVAQAFNTDPAQCIGIEDAAAGVQSIKSAQMFAVGIGDQVILSQADHVYAEVGQFDIDFILQAHGQ